LEEEDVTKNMNINNKNKILKTLVLCNESW